MITDEQVERAQTALGLEGVYVGSKTVRRALEAAHLSPSASEAQCCTCGKKGLSTVEGDGGAECELTDGRWVCSGECWDKAVDPHSASEAQVRVKALEWREGTYTTTDDDGGPMEGIPRKLYAWRSEGYTIIRQSGADGLFILRGKADGVGLIVATLEKAKAAAQADYERRVLSALTPEQGETAPSPGSHSHSRTLIQLANAVLAEAPATATQFMGVQLADIRAALAAEGRE